MKRFIHASLFFFASLIAAQTIHAQGFAPVWNPGHLADIQSFAAGEKIAGTHYFYWYDYPGHHFFDDRARTNDGLQDHFIDPQAVSYRDANWHAEQLDDIAAAGLDFILPVYWGTPDNYFKPDISFSVEGLGPLQLAADRRLREGKSAAKIGLFYDTSSLLSGVRGELGVAGKFDLRQEKGRDIFYRTIRDFFYQIHPRHWAAVDGRPVVVLYGAGFASHHDQGLFDYVARRFQEDFHGRTPFMIRDQSWDAKTDAATQWGAALDGPYIFETVAQIGPGYNDSAVPGRSTPIRERENGDFYRWGWNRILRSNVSIALIETWNEMHEGTSICRSKEYGSQYIELTREYVARWKKGTAPAPEIALEFAEPRLRPASERGIEFKNAKQASIAFGDSEGGKGIWLVRGQPDGPAKQEEKGGKACVSSAGGATSYLYFDIADPFVFDADGAARITYMYLDDGFSWHALEHDSRDRNATLKGAYTSSERVECKNTKTWISRTIAIDNARFANRQNGGADFRFAASGPLSIHSVVVEKVQ